MGALVSDSTSVPEPDETAADAPVRPLRSIRQSLAAIVLGFEVIVDAAHNPHGARARVDAVDEYFDFDDIVFVFGVLADKDADGMVEELARANGTFIVTTSHSERARDVHELAGIVATHVGADRVQAVARLDDALDEARAWAEAAPKRAVVVAGSIVLVGEAIAIAADREWGRS